MKLIIAGTRTLNPSIAFIYGAIESFGLNHVKEIVSGTAKGVDTCGEDYAQYYNIYIMSFPAKWDKHGKVAGFIRNNQMAHYADALLLIWDGKSNGSSHMKNEMLKLKKPIYEIIIRWSNE